MCRERSAGQRLVLAVSGGAAAGRVLLSLVPPWCSRGEGVLVSHNAPSPTHGGIEGGGGAVENIVQ